MGGVAVGKAAKLPFPSQSYIGCPKISLQYSVVSKCHIASFLLMFICQGAKMVLKKQQEQANLILNQGS